MLLGKSWGRQNTFTVLYYIYWYHKSMCKWTCTFQNHVVQGSTVLHWIPQWKMGSKFQVFLWQGRGSFVFFFFWLENKDLTISSSQAKVKWSWRIPYLPRLEYFSSFHLHSSMPNEAGFRRVLSLFGFSPWLQVVLQLIFIPKAVYRMLKIMGKIFFWRYMLMWLFWQYNQRLFPNK